MKEIIKKQFIAPEFEVIIINEEVITTSGEDATDEEGNGGCYLG